MKMQHRKGVPRFGQHRMIRIVNSFEHEWVVNDALVDNACLPRTGTLKDRWLSYVSLNLYIIMVVGDRENFPCHAGTINIGNRFFQIAKAACM